MQMVQLFWTDFQSVCNFSKWGLTTWNNPKDDNKAKFGEIINNFDEIINKSSQKCLDLDHNWWRVTWLKKKSSSRKSFWGHNKTKQVGRQEILISIKILKVFWILLWYHLGLESLEWTISIRLGSTTMVSLPLLQPLWSWSSQGRRSRRWWWWWWWWPWCRAAVACLLLVPTAFLHGRHPCPPCKLHCIIQ